MRIKQKAIAALFFLLVFPGSAWATISEYLSAAEGKQQAFLGVATACLT